VSVRLVAAGHPAVTGRHGKTLEITADPAITARATCVLGTAAGPLPGDLPGLRGRVRVQLAVGDLVAAVEGEVNPYYASTTRLVLRRSDLLDEDTFLVNASAAAADLDRTLVARLREPGARLEVTAAEVGSPDPVLLVLLDPVPAAAAALAGSVPAPVAALAGQVEHVVDLGGPAVPLTGRRHRGVPADPGALAGARTVAVLAGSLDLLSAGTPARERLAAALPRARVLLWPPAAPAADLLVAAGAPTRPVLHAGRLPTGRRELPALAAVLSAAPAATLTLDPGPVPPVAPVLDDLRGRLPEHALLLPDPAVGWGVGAVEVPPAAPLDPALLAGLRRAPAVAFARRGDAPAPLTVDPGELARALRAAGVSGRSATAVLTALGLPRREAYRLATEPPAQP
jgi:hypothetical protein